VRAWTVEEARRTLEFTADALEQRIDVDCYLDSGNPVRRLVELAARKHALLLVVGTPGGASDQPPSIIASGVSRSAPCPVVVVRHGSRVPHLHLPQDDS
jgi:nucleotide-binding universal stress UspA family protein